MGRRPLPQHIKDLRPLVALAKRRGYDARIHHDHVVARNDHGCIRTASIDTLRKLLGG